MVNAIDLREIALTMVNPQPFNGSCHIVITLTNLYRSLLKIVDSSIYFGPKSGNGNPYILFTVDNIGFELAVGFSYFGTIFDVIDVIYRGTVHLDASHTRNMYIFFTHS